MWDLGVNQHGNYVLLRNKTCFKAQRLFWDKKQVMQQNAHYYILIYANVCFMCV